MKRRPLEFIIIIERRANVSNHALSFFAGGFSLSFVFEDANAQLHLLRCSRACALQTSVPSVQSCYCRDALFYFGIPDYFGCILRPYTAFLTGSHRLDKVREFETVHAEPRRLNGGAAPQPGTDSRGDPSTRRRQRRWCDKLLSRQARRPVVCWAALSPSRPMADGRCSGARGGGGEAGGGTWSFLTKTIPSVSGFVTTVASKWLSDQESIEDQQRDAELETEIQTQITKISSLLREQERPLARDGTCNMDMEIQHQLTRIQELLEETKRRGGPASDGSIQRRGPVGGAASAHAGGGSVRGDSASQASRAGGGVGRSNYLPDEATASPAHTPCGSDAGWSTAESTPGHSVAPTQWSNTPQHPHVARAAAPFSAGARLGGGSGSMTRPAYPETPLAAATMRMPAHVGDGASEIDDLGSTARRLADKFDSPALLRGGARGEGGGESRRSGSKKEKMNSRPPPQAVDQDELRALFSRARHGRYKDVEAMLEGGLSANLRDEYGNTLLTVAAQNGNKRIAKICLRQGCNINAQNFRGQTALHYCFAFGYEELGQYLISKGANSNVPNEYGLSAREGLEPKESVVPLTSDFAGAGAYDSPMGAGPAGGAGGGDGGGGGVLAGGESGGWGAALQGVHKSLSRVRGGGGVRIEDGKSCGRQRRDDDEESSVSVTSTASRASLASNVASDISADTYASSVVDVGKFENLDISVPARQYSMSSGQTREVAAWAGGEPRARSAGNKERDTFSRRHEDGGGGSVRDCALLSLEGSRLVVFDGEEEEVAPGETLQARASHLEELVLSLRRLQAQFLPLPHPRPHSSSLPVSLSVKISPRFLSSSEHIRVLI
jgi:hypothetical protein